MGVGAGVYQPAAPQPDSCYIGKDLSQEDIPDRQLRGPDLLRFRLQQ